MIEIRPHSVVFCESEGDVERAISLAEADGSTITCRGGGTSIPTQSVGKGYVLVQEMKSIRVAEPDIVFASPAVVKADLNAFLGRDSRWMPVDPSSFRSCSIGGMAANNSSGVRTLKYGSTIDYVPSLTAFIPGTGLRRMSRLNLEEAASLGAPSSVAIEIVADARKEILEETPRVTKNSCGYRLERLIEGDYANLAALLVGSEGTLGVFTEVAFRILAGPPDRRLLIVECTLDELDETVTKLKSLEPSAIELLDKSVFERTGRSSMLTKYARTDRPYLVFCEVESAIEEQGQESSLDSVVDLDPLFIQGGAELSEAWGVRNETLVLAGEIRKGTKTLLPGVEDLVVPTDRLGDLVGFMMGQFEGRGLEYISYGHAGDANLHMRPLLDRDSPHDRRILEGLMEESFEKVWRLGGSITGEHGDGMIRAPYVERQYPRTYQVMQDVKAAFDPKGLLNPGVKVSR